MLPEHPQTKILAYHLQVLLPSFRA
jgi:hypothetical protein